MKFGANDTTAINTIRFLAIDMVEKARSGHPGAPMGQAPMAHVLWTKFLRVDPKKPDWPNRDRFILSCGHASALLYSLMYLSGYEITLEDLKSFRQLGSKTAGHPERRLIKGIETTTGPLGQGFGNAVGLAIAREKLAAEFNKDSITIFDFRVWVIVSDGDLMEGISYEAASLAGHLRLGNLKVLYDANDITIDGKLSLAFSEDVEARFRAQGWEVLKVKDGNDLEEIYLSLQKAEQIKDKPTLIIIKTHIGYGSPNLQDSEKVHGAPMGREETILTKKRFRWPIDKEFFVPESAFRPYDQLREKGKRYRKEWENKLEIYKEKYPKEYKELLRRLQKKLPEGWKKELPVFGVDNSPVATRKVSGKTLQKLAANIPELIGGSADLSESNNTVIKSGGIFSADNRLGRNFHFGVREHAMGSILSGLALSGMYRPYGGTFLVFSDYMRPAIRMAALMNLPVIYIFTHDSIFVGEDGPTHQPEAHIPALRAIPNLTVIRPGCANETVVAWEEAIERKNPVAIILTRQPIDFVDIPIQKAREGMKKGGYSVSAPPNKVSPKIILVASGSELPLAYKTHLTLESQNIPNTLVSLPSWEILKEQEEEYVKNLFPPHIPKLAIEATVPFGWHDLLGPNTYVHGVEGFGYSGPWKKLAEYFGFTEKNITEKALQIINSLSSTDR